MITRRAVSVAVPALGFLAVSAAVHAQPSAAEAAFNKGLADMQAGRYETGCPALAESQRLDPRAGTLFTLAECENKRGKIATALGHYRDFLALVEGMKPDQKARQAERVKIAQSQKAALDDKVPTLTVTVQAGAPPGISVRRDGVEIAASAIGEAIPVDPGDHVVQSRVPGGKDAERKISISPGDHRQIVVDAKGDLEASGAASSSGSGGASPGEGVATPSSSSRRIGAYVAGGVGVVGLVIGGITGGLTLGKKGVINKNCGLFGDPLLCNHEGKLAADSSKTLGIASDIGFAVGGAGVVAAVVLLVTEPKKKATSGRGPAVRGDVLAAGREGAVLGLRGAW